MFRERWVFDRRENITQLWTELYAFGGGLIYSSGVFIVVEVVGFLESGSFGNSENCCVYIYMMK